MQVMRTIVWAVITAVLVAFIAMNWNGAAVNFWPLEGKNNYLHFEWPVGVIALIFFLLGFTPMWLFYRAQGWRLKRRIATLENSLRAASAVAPAEPAEPAAASPALPVDTPVISGPAPSPTEESNRNDVP
ncbi:MAG: LapA family protein [Novosphingobium sp.]|nr:LapA family protein [Novosphingobium sp.]